MDVLALIVLNVILPVFVLIVAGALLHRKFNFDMNTLSKLSTYVLLPAVSFVNIFESRIGGSALVAVIGFLICQSVSLILVSAGIAKAAKFDPKLSVTFKNSVVLGNSGNFGLPVSQLVFHSNPLGASIQVIVSIFQNMLTFTYGLLNSVSVKRKDANVFKEFVKLPTVYALAAGLLLNAFHIKLPDFIWKPIDNVSNAFLAIALFTLGAQSAYLKLQRLSLPLLLSLAGRLLVSPSIAFVVILLLRLEGTVAQALFIASSYPTSRNSAMFALEYDNHPEYAAQTVLLSTLLSSFTVALVVYLAKIVF
jgi:predicted permease